MNDDFIVRPKPEPKQTPPPTPEPTAPEPASPPEEVVDETNTQEEHQLGEESVTDDILPEDKTAKQQGKKKRRSPKEWFLSLTKKQKILFCTALFLSLALLGIGVYALTDSSADTTPQKAAAKKQAAAKPKTEASRLTGLQVSPELNKRGVTGVMIENSQEARPQSGLKDAGVVFEAIAEGGITRFLALFQDAQPDYIGPVRSVRPYYLDWLQGFDAPIAHAGGSADGLAKIKNDNIPDLDQFANGSYYDRVDSRAAPHNLYTNFAKLDVLKASKGITGSTFTGFLRKSEKANKTPTASTIDINISSAPFNVHYDYDAKTNSYKRSEGGAPHIDEKSGAQLTPKVVVAMVMSQGSQSGYTTYQTLGSGHCFIFQDGIVSEGNWEKPSSKDQIVFKDARGGDLKLNPGQTWVSMVNATSSVSYKP